MINEEEKLNNTDYYVLCVLELRPRFNTGEVFDIKELAYICDLDKSEASKSLKKLKQYELIKVITEKPLNYSFNSEILEKWR